MMEQHKVLGILMRGIKRQKKKRVSALNPAYLMERHGTSRMVSVHVGEEKRENIILIKGERIDSMMNLDSRLRENLGRLKVSLGNLQKGSLDHQRENLCPHLQKENLDHLKMGRILREMENLVLRVVGKEARILAESLAVVLGKGRAVGAENRLVIAEEMEGLELQVELYKWIIDSLIISLGSEEVWIDCRRDLNLRFCDDNKI